MTRYETFGQCELHLGDCRGWCLPTSSVILSDPPYGIGYTHSGGHGRFSKVGVTYAATRRGVPPIRGDDTAFDPTRWLAYNEVLLWGADHFYLRLPDYGRWLAFNKLDYLEPWDTFSDVEFAWHSIDSAARVFNMKWKGIACDKKGESNGLREHPTQKPVALMRWCIDQLSNKVGTIVDPYMGSGTTAIACIQLGRPFIGIEIEQRWFDVACRRVERESRQLRLEGIGV